MAMAAIEVAASEVAVERARAVVVRVMAAPAVAASGVAVERAKAVAVRVMVQTAAPAVTGEGWTEALARST